MQSPVVALQVAQLGPRTQSLQTAAPALLLNLPAGQLVQPRIALPPTWNVPAKHCMHVPAATDWPYPSPHFEHGLAEPGTEVSRKYPALHAMHTPVNASHPVQRAPALEQGVHDTDPGAAANVPATHAAQACEALPTARAYPTGHCTHGAPGLTRPKPDAQSRHDRVPSRK